MMGAKQGAEIPQWNRFKPTLTPLNRPQICKNQVVDGLVRENKITQEDAPHHIYSLSHFF
jgi:hypothetical protein